MYQITGLDGKVVVGEETTYGVDPVSPDGKLLYFVKGLPSKKQKLIQPNTLTGSRGKGRSVPGNVTDDGSLEVELNATSCGLFFKHLMGTVAHSGTGPYTHTYTVGKLAGSLWIEEDAGDTLTTGRYIRHNGVVINDCTFNLAAEGLVSTTFSLIGRDGKLYSSPLDATATDNGFYPFSQFDATIEDNGTVLANVKSGSIKISNNRASDTYVVGGAGLRAAAAAGQVDITGSVTVLYTDQDLLTKSLERTSSTLKLTYQFGDGLGTAGNESIELFVQNLDYEVGTPEISGPGGREVTLNFMGFKSGSDLGFRIIEKNMIPTF